MAYQRSVRTLSLQRTRQPGTISPESRSDFREGARRLEGYVGERRSVLPFVPAACPFCGAAYQGGCAPPGARFTDVGLRVFYRCGTSVSVWCDFGDGAVHLLAKNCQTVNGLPAAAGADNGVSP